MIKNFVEKILFFDIALFMLYTASLGAALLIIKYWITPLRIAWQSGGYVLVPLLCVGIGALLYVIGFLLWLIILARHDLTVVYPIAIGLTIIATTLGSVTFLSEAISPLRIAGMIFILLGVALVVRS